ncbi:hypothetical protein HNR51_005342 [Methylorubrum thiocyanatum]|uniref:Uncharacterized protein n=1 Tax=Methylorubrum thiocyanatum TaxID=47958 RepID=A0AA40S7Y6_9HYPH|nr:hypothetical protein [Methylorubrum thiocyanatum]
MTPRQDGERGANLLYRELHARDFTGGYDIIRR